MKSRWKAQHQIKRREEAEARQSAYNNLSTIAKLHKLGGYRAIKQRERLEAQLEQEN